MLEKKRICILSFSTIAWDSRVLRQVDASRKIHSVDVIAFGEWNPPDGVRYFRLNKTKRSKFQTVEYVLSLLSGRVLRSTYERAFWMHPEYQEARDILLRENYDLIHANDWNSLPVSVTAARQLGTPVLFDAHEYSLTEEADNPLWKFLIPPYREYLYETYQPVNARITVADGIRDLYRDRFNWHMDVILNAPPYVKVPYHATSSARIKLVHHGAAVSNRFLEDFIHLLAMLDKRYELYFYLLPTQPAYLKQLSELAGKVAPGRVFFCEPIPPRDLVHQLSNYDIGIPLLAVQQSTYFNALPNKFFDFIMSGLAIAVSPLPMMQRIVAEHKIGIVSADQTYQSMAKSLNALSADEINSYKLNSLELAKSMNAETEHQKLLGIYQKILSN